MDVDQRLAAPAAAASPAPNAAAARPPRGRWLQLVFGVFCMVQIANLQYGWTLFVSPLEQKFHWGRASIQVAFTLFVLTETWLVPVEGYLVDRFGPRAVVMGGGLFCGLSWWMNSWADSLFWLYAAAILGGIGAGGVYGTAVGNSLKWFPDRRGLAAGLTAAGFGAGSALTVAPIAETIRSAGYEVAFLRFGLVQGVLILLFGAFLRSPRSIDLPLSAKVSQSAVDFRPGEALRSPLFWVMYAAFVMVATGGLMVTANLAPIAKDFKVGDQAVTLLGLTLPALTFALSIDRVLNGVTRPFFGWVSDHFGRERTMFFAFVVEGLGILALVRFANQPALFVVLSGLVFFAWGEIYSLFPATCADIYGKRYVTTIYGMLYTAKGTAALLVPVSAWIAQKSGWGGVFNAAAALNFAAAFVILFVLKPARDRLHNVRLIPDARGIPRL
jgi:MFS transporter, OFA family, oxalate/formate antiporter